MAPPEADYNHENTKNGKHEIVFLFFFFMFLFFRDFVMVFLGFRFIRVKKCRENFLAISLYRSIR